MIENIRVRCLVDRFWDTQILEWDGSEINGTLIGISTQTADDSSGTSISGNLIPVGVVLLDDNTFQSVPMEFIEKIGD